MLFIGQHHIMNYLSIVLRELYKNPDMGANLLLDGPSGYGKTTMALAICGFLAEKDFETYLYDREPFRFQKRVVFIDEIHRMKDPEILYPVMDSKKHVLVLATNHTGTLPEALRNRCQELIFTNYSEEELTLIAMRHSTFQASTENYIKLVNASNSNPRILKRLVDNFGMYFRQHPEINSQTADFTEILENVFQISEGLDTLSRRYLEVLGTVGGKASLNLLAKILQVDKDTVQNQVETVLVQKGMIQITPKGRILL